MVSRECSILWCAIAVACARNRTFLWMRNARKRGALPGGIRTRKDLVAYQHRAALPGAGLLRPAPWTSPQPALNLNQLTAPGPPGLSRPPAILRVNARPLAATASSRQGRTQMPGVKKPIDNPSPTPSRSSSSATPARRSPCSPKPYPAYSPCLWPAASTKFVFPTATTEPAGQMILADRLAAIRSRSTSWPTLTTPPEHRARFAGHDNHFGHAGQKQQRSFLPGSTPPPNRRGPRRPVKYGKKIQVAALLKQTGQFQKAPSPSM